MMRMTDSRQRDPNRLHGDSKAYRARKKAELASLYELLMMAKAALPFIENPIIYIDLSTAITKAEGR